MEKLITIVAYKLTCANLNSYANLLIFQAVSVCGIWLCNAKKKKKSKARYGFAGSFFAGGGGQTKRYCFLIKIRFSFHLISFFFKFHLFISTREDPFNISCLSMGLRIKRLLNVMK